MPKSVKKNTHKKRNFKKTRKYKTRNLRKTVKHNKRNFKKTRKYKGGVFLELPWKKRAREKREEEIKRKEDEEKKREEEEKQQYAKDNEDKRKKAYDVFKEQYDEKNIEDKLKLWELWAKTKNITTDKTYSKEEKIRAVNKGILYYYFKVYIKNPITVEESCTYDIIKIITKISNFSGYGINKQTKVITSNEVFKTIKTLPIKFEKKYYSRFLDDDTNIMTIEKSLVTPMEEVNQMWEKLPETETTHITQISSGHYYYNETRYSNSIFPDQYVRDNVGSLDFEADDNNTDVDFLINKKKDNGFSIQNEELLDYIFEPKIEDNDKCTIIDGYVLNKQYTGADGEIELLIDNCGFTQMRDGFTTNAV